MKNILYCGNCGKGGHLYKTCYAPIISLGIILIDRSQKPYKYLMVQRRDTLGFVEFMRGKYSITNITYIKKLFGLMTLDERTNIINNSFDTLWDKLWMKNTNRHSFNEYDTSKYKFNIFKRGIIKNDEFINFNTINNTMPFIYNSPEWGFPKGRRNTFENDLDCAKREFEEETGILEDQYKLLSGNRFSETFFGSNNIRYKHIYYLAEILDKNIELKIDPNNKFQATEISNIKWYNFLECINIIRPYNIEKKNVIKKINAFINN